MPQSNTLVQAAHAAIQAKHGESRMWGANNQYRIELPNGASVVVKTGSKGQVMQRTLGEEADSEFIGLDKADYVVIAVQNGPADPIMVYEVPAAAYRDRMKQEYEARFQFANLRPTDLRVLRFDERGYPFQRVAKEWEGYRLKFHAAPIEQGPRPTSPPRPEISDQAVQAAKKMVAEAFGVSVDKVNISVNF